MARQSRAKVQIAPARLKTTIEETTHFLNVDLEVKSRSNLQPLIDSINESKLAHELSSFCFGGLYHAGFEVSSYVKKIDPIIRIFARIIGERPPEPRRLWDRAVRRDLNIGIQSGLKGETYSIDADIVALAAKINAQIVITLYGAKRKALKPPRSDRRLGSFS